MCETARGRTCVRECVGPNASGSRERTLCALACMCDGSRQVCVQLATACGSRACVARNGTRLAGRRRRSRLARPRTPEYVKVITTLAKMVSRKRTRSASRSAHPRTESRTTCTGSVCELAGVSVSSQGTRRERWEFRGGSRRRARQDGSRKPAQTQTQQGAGQACLPMRHQSEAEDAACRQGCSSWRSNFKACQLAACSAGITKGSVRGLRSSWQRARKRCTRRRGRQAGWLRARLAACVRRTS